MVTAPKPKPKPQGTAHSYTIHVSTNCSAGNAFSQLLQPGMSGPGTPAAQDGTHLINLPSFIGPLGSPNPISQNVNLSTMTITNTTQAGHVFDPGSVVIQVTATSSNTSDITITGTGTGNDPVFNDLVGEAIFGTIAGSVESVCDPAVGT